MKMCKYLSEHIQTDRAWPFKCTLYADHGMRHEYFSKIELNALSVKPDKATLRTVRPSRSASKLGPSSLASQPDDRELMDSSYWKQIRSRLLDDAIGVPVVVVWVAV